MKNIGNRVRKESKYGKGLARIVERNRGREDKYEKISKEPNKRSF